MPKYFIRVLSMELNFKSTDMLRSALNSDWNRCSWMLNIEHNITLLHRMFLCSFKWVKSNSKQTNNKNPIKMNARRQQNTQPGSPLFTKVLYCTMSLDTHTLSASNTESILSTKRANELIIMNYPHCWIMLMKWCSLVARSKCIVKIRGNGKMDGLCVESEMV